MRARTGLWVPRGGNARRPPGPEQRSELRFAPLVVTRNSGVDLFVWLQNEDKDRERTGVSCREYFAGI